MKVTTRRRIFIITIITIVILAVAYGFMPKPVPVDYVKASRGPMRVTIEEEGKTRVKDRFVISSPVAGFMRRIELKAGDPVKKGQALVELESLRPIVLDPRSRAEAEAVVSAAQSALNAALENARAAEAEAGYAKKKLDRYKTLYDTGYVTRDMLEASDSEANRTEANRLSMEAKVKVARSELDKARSALRYSLEKGFDNQGKVVVIHAPANGYVLTIHHESEGVVNAGEPLIDIGDPEKLEVKVEVLSADAVNIGPGTPVLFERWGGDSPLSGKVRVVEPAAFTKISSLGVEEQRVLVIADIDLLPQSRKMLGDGYRVEAVFIIWEGKDILQVPASALFRKGRDWSAFVVQNKRAHLRSLEVGHRNGLTAEIVSGISEGEMVVTNPDDPIKDGARIRLR